MTLEEFEQFVERDGIEWAEDEENFYFRDTNFPYYETNALEVKKEKMASLSPDELDREIHSGLRVEHITRVTGYFAKVNSWNAGKRGELKDRAKTDF